MAVTVANVSATNTFGFWKDRTNELADAMTNKVVTTETAATTGNAAITGTFSANVIAIGNSTVNVSILSSNSTQQSSGNYYLNANGSWVATNFYSATLDTSGTGSQLIDSYEISKYNSAEWLINVKNNVGSGYHTTKILAMYDTSVYQTEYATINTATIVTEFTTSANATHVRLYVTPAVSNTTVKLSRIVA